ncbi:MAG: PA0069 family radical SAM protein [Deltaproteobacteria bacterium]|nr:PA0069 family radical SAM protein [Deltaproteobacteria bacterium]
MLRPVSNPPNPWSSTHVEWIGEPPAAALEVFEEKARAILAQNESPDLPFRWSLNPYRGCTHACAYCYARPSHQYLGLGAGTDFDRKIVVKVNAPERLRATLQRRSWKRELIMFSGNTDAYQPLEAAYRLTRGCLEVCHVFRTPVAVITKSALVRRDIDVLAAMARDGLASVFISIPILDDALSRKIEPNASLPSKRFETLALLAGSGIPTGVSVSPVIPGLSESDIPTILERAYAAGARRAFSIPLRLAPEVEVVFGERLRSALDPARVRHVESALRDVRGGKMNETAFGKRMRGVGARWEIIAQLFHSTCRRLGFNAEPADAIPEASQPAPRIGRQLKLL